MQRQGRSSQETIVQPWGRVLVPPQGIQTTTSLSCFADTESPTRWEMLTVCCSQACRPQTGWNQKVDDADSQLPHHQPIRRTYELITPSLNHYYKTVHYLPQVGTHSSEGISLLWPPLPGKAKLFFSTSPKLCLGDLTRCQGTEAGFSFAILFN